MSLSPTVAECAKEYEQAHGHAPDDLTLQVGEHILKVGVMLTDRGRQDAQEGNIPSPSAVFPALVRKAFRMKPNESHSVVQDIADLWQDYYMDGYTAATESR